MAVFEYKGLDSSGKAVSGIIEADSPRSARQQLKKSDVFANEITEAKTSSVSAEVKGGGFSLRKGISLSELSLVTRQIATLLDAGLPLVAALGSLLEQTESQTTSLVLSQVRQRVNEGASFYEALAEHPKVFNELYINMVRAGEASGTLPLVLERLADLLESSVELRRKIFTAMAYPVLMGFVMLGILTLLMVKVVPEVTKVFDNMGRELPPITKALMAVSGFSQDYWPVGFISIILGLILFRSYYKSESGRWTVDSALLNFPKFGHFIRLAAQARFARTLGSLVSAGVPLMEALNISKPVLGNVVMEKALDKAANNVREGLGLSESLKMNGEFSAELRQMVAVGEESGALDKMLLKIAHAFEGRLDGVVTSLTSILEPLMILGMGVVVGLVVFAILLPIMDMTGAIQ